MSITVKQQETIEQLKQQINSNTSNIKAIKLVLILFKKIKSIKYWSSMSLLKELYKTNDIACNTKDHVIKSLLHTYEYFMESVLDTRSDNFIVY